MSIKTVVSAMTMTDKVYGSLTVGGVIFLFTTFITQTNADKEHQVLQANIDRLEQRQNEYRIELKKDLTSILRDLKLEIREKKQFR